MRGSLKPLFDNALSEASLRREDLFEPVAARQVWDDFLAGRVAWNRPWLLAVAQLWCRHVREEALAAGTLARAAAPLPAGAGIPA